MAVKHVELPGIGTVTLQKRRGSRNLRISISPSGLVKVSLPPWAPYKMASEYAWSKREWILKNRPTLQLIADNTRVGKAHQIIFLTNSRLQRPNTRVRGNEIIISLPPAIATTDSKAQELAVKAAVKVLKIEAQQLLPGRLRQLAQDHGFSYKSVIIKRLSSRWGSCDRQGNITLNCYLMQLPWYLIDYVLLHELTHTRIMAHGPKFWAELGKYIPSLPAIRKEIRLNRPLLNL